MSNEHLTLQRVYDANTALKSDIKNDERKTDFCDAILDCLYFVTEGAIVKSGVVIEGETQEGLVLTANTLPGGGRYSDITVLNILRKNASLKEGERMTIATLVTESRMTPNGMKTETYRYRIIDQNQLPKGEEEMFDIFAGLAINVYAKKIGIR